MFTMILYDLLDENHDEISTSYQSERGILPWLSTRRDNMPSRQNIETDSIVVWCIARNEEDITVITSDASKYLPDILSCG